MSTTLAVFRLTLVGAVASTAFLLSACTQRTTAQSDVRPVYVSTVAAADMSESRTFTGAIHARVESELAFRTGGKVVQRLVDVGTLVAAGQPLARLDAADYALAVKAAEDQVRAAQADADQSASDEARFGRLAAEGSIGAADHERQKAKADAAAARLDQAQRQLALARNRDGYTTLTAPYSGVVTALRVELGQVVAEGQAVLALAREGEREVVADIPEEWVGRVRAATATITTWSAPKGPVLTLRLRELSPLASVQGRMFRARFGATADSHTALAKLPLGSTAELQLSSKESADRGMRVPLTALVKGNGAPGVWVINEAGSGLLFKTVQVQSIDETTLRVKGLKPGEKVVSVGAQKLDPGLKVRAIERDQAQLARAFTRSES